MIKYIGKLLANSLHSCGIPQFAYKTRLRRNKAMFKKLFGPRRFRVATMVGVPAQCGFMLAAVIGEKNFAAIFGVIAIIAISLWCEDVMAEKNTRKKNKGYIIAVLTSIFLTSVLTPAYAISPALMIEMIIEVAFMAAMLTDTKLMP